MKILQVHNYYQSSGGEDTVVASEKALLEENGNEVITYSRHNNEIEDYSLLQKLNLIQNATWSKRSYQDAKKIIQEQKPDICHIHNFFPLISTSIYQACKELSVPVVQTLHNYRLICTNALFLKEGKVCELCLNKSAYTSIKHKCYRGSYLQTFTVARMIEQNKKAKTWETKVDAFLCFTEFAKSKFIQQGIPSEKIHIKSNFVEHPSSELPKPSRDYFVYVGRLEENKGILLLKKVANKLKLPIKLIGEGDLDKEFKNEPNIQLLGKKSHNETLEYIRNAKALLFPPLCYEGMPMTRLEAFARKTPVIASNMGAMQAMIEHNQNGLLFEPNSAEDLLKCIDEIKPLLSQNAFDTYLSKYSKEANYNTLINTYKTAIK